MSFDLITCMQSFVSVAECNGFSPAARKLRISAPALTKQIKYLEEWVGKRLLERTTRHVALTEAGKTYQKQCQKILSDIQEARNEVHHLEKEPHGLLTIGIPGVFNSNSMFYMELMRDFLKKYPKITLQTIEENSPTQLMNDKADLIISQENLHESQLIKEKLFAFRRGLFASPIYIKEHGRPKTLADLKNHNCIIYNKVSPDSCWVFPNNKKVPVKGNFISNSSMNTRCAAVVGMGLLWCSPLVVDEELKSGRLVEIKLKLSKPFLCDVYIYHKPVRQGSNVKLMVDHLKKKITKQIF